MKSSGRTQPKPTHGLSLEFQNSYFTSLDVSSFLYLLHLMHFQRLCILLKNRNHTQKKRKNSSGSLPLSSLISDAFIYSFYKLQGRGRGKHTLSLLASSLLLLRGQGRTRRRRRTMMVRMRRRSPHENTSPHRERPGRPPTALLQGPGPGSRGPALGVQGPRLSPSSHQQPGEPLSRVGEGRQPPALPPPLPSPPPRATYPQQANFQLPQSHGRAGCAFTERRRRGPERS